MSITGPGSTAAAMAKGIPMRHAPYCDPSLHDEDEVGPCASTLVTVAGVTSWLTGTDVGRCVLVAPSVELDAGELLSLIGVLETALRGLRLAAA